MTEERKAENEAYIIGKGTLVNSDNMQWLNK